MTLARSINSPGIELREVDRSAYSSIQDNSLPNAPTVLITGVASKGKNYVPQQINSKGSFIDLYGIPELEERFFYNWYSEILDSDSVYIGCKLPYDNIESENGGRYIYCDYSVCLSKNNPDSDKIKIKKIGDNEDIEVIINELGDLSSELIKLLKYTRNILR